MTSTGSKLKASMSPTIHVQKLTKVYRTYEKEPGFWGALRGLAHRRYKETAAAREVGFLGRTARARQRC
jgi:hypothetical protein